jgi:hypothetical protein
MDGIMGTEIGVFGGLFGGCHKNRTLLDHLPKGQRSAPKQTLTVMGLHNRV